MDIVINNEGFKEKEIVHADYGFSVSSRGHVYNIYKDADGLRIITNGASIVIKPLGVGGVVLSQER